MPYIKAIRREHIDAGIEPCCPGELNYSITKLLTGYIETMGGISYQTINDIVGALEGAKLEFYRRIAEPYESAKSKENGDVY